MQTDARLIEHIQNTGETGTDLSGQTNPLRFSTGQRHRRPIQAQVVEPHIQQELQPQPDLPQHQITDLNLAIIQQWVGTLMAANPHQLLDAVKGLTNADGRQLRNAERAHLHGEGFRPQPLTGAGLARD